MVKKEGRKWVVRAESTGRSFGKYDTKAEGGEAAAPGGGAQEGQGPLTVAEANEIQRALVAYADFTDVELLLLYIVVKHGRPRTAVLGLDAVMRLLPDLGERFDTAMRRRWASA